MPVESRIMGDYHLISDIMGRFTHDISSEVKYKYLRCYLQDIFPRTTLERAEGKGKADCEIMLEICRNASRLSMMNFLRFLAAVRNDYPHVYNNINNYYRERTGNNLPNYENAPASPQNAPVHSQSTSASPQSTSASSQSTPASPQSTPVSPQSTPVSPENASVPSQNAESLEPNTSTAGFMDICDPIEMAVPEASSNSSSVSGLPPETTESSGCSGYITCVSLGPAVPCPSDETSSQFSAASLGISAELPSDLSESKQIPVESSSLEVSSTGPNRSASFGSDGPVEATEHH